MYLFHSGCSWVTVEGLAPVASYVTFFFIPASGARTYDVHSPHTQGEGCMGRNH